jgi:hypothetical protein
MITERKCKHDVWLPWLSDGAEPDADMWARPDETSERIVELYRSTWEFADAAIDELPAGRRRTSVVVGRRFGHPPPRSRPADSMRSTSGGLRLVTTRCRRGTGARLG